MIKKDQPAYLLAGSEQFLKQENLAQIKAAFLEEASSEFNFNVFYAGSESAGSILECAYTQPFLAKRRLLLIHQVEEFSAADKRLILSYLKAPHQQTSLVLETNQDYLEQGFFSEVAQYAHLIPCNPPPAGGVPGWIKAYLLRQNKKISQPALALLIEQLGANLQSLASALDSLISYIADRDRIELADVDVLVGMDVTGGVFELFNAVRASDKDSCFEILDSLLKKGANSAQILGAFAHKVISGSRGPLFEQELLDLQRTDSEIKSGRQHPRLALELLLVRMLGVCPNRLGRLFKTC